MSNFHSTVSRREFMKGLGLTGAGLGAAAALTPVFHDMDEVISSRASEWKRPWWAAAKDAPSVPIDWSRMKRRDKTFQEPYGGGSVYGGLSGSSSHPASIALRATADPLGVGWSRAVNDAKLREKYPDWTTDSLRNLALASSTVSARARINSQPTGKTPFLGLQAGPTPASRNLPKWEGNPDENLRMIRAAARLWGALDVGVMELNENTKKLVCAVGGDGRKWVLDSSDDQPSRTDTEYRVPSRFKYLIVFSNMQPNELTRRAPSQLGYTATMNAYYRWSQIRVPLQEFLYCLGYQGLDMQSDIPANAIASMTGIGEHARIGNPTVSPEYGSQLRAIERMITDLPLTPTKPVDAGIREFCMTCKVCAEYCPTGALMMGDPSYEVDPEWRPGVLDAPFAHNGWHQSNYRCNSCQACPGICTFNSTKDSPIHDVVLATQSVTPLFNSFFASMHRTFRYGPTDPETWWENEHPVFDLSPKHIAVK